MSLRATAPDKYALAILTALFTDEEMGRSCYATTSRSTKPPLPADKIALLEGIIIVRICCKDSPIVCLWFGISLQSVSTINLEEEP